MGATAVAFAGSDNPDPVAAAAALADPDPVRLRASELIAKHLGMLVDRIETKDTTDRRLASIAPADLAQLLALARAALAPPEPLDVTPKRLEAAPARETAPSDDDLAP